MPFPSSAHTYAFHALHLLCPCHFPHLPIFALFCLCTVTVALCLFSCYLPPAHPPHLAFLPLLISLSPPLPCTLPFSFLPCLQHLSHLFYHCTPHAHIHLPHMPTLHTTLHAHTCTPHNCLHHLYFSLASKHAYSRTRACRLVDGLRAACLRPLYRGAHWPRSRGDGFARCVSCSCTCRGAAGILSRLPPSSLPAHCTPILRCNASWLLQHLHSCRGKHLFLRKISGWTWTLKTPVRGNTPSFTRAHNTSHRGALAAALGVILVETWNDATAIPHFVAHISWQHLYSLYVYPHPRQRLS